MNYPEFYEPERIGQIYLPRTEAIKKQAFAAKAQQKEAPKNRAAFLLIDYQVDFTLPQGALYVPGAEKDLERAIEFILKNMNKITCFYPTLDTHQSFQIFYSQWWVDQEKKQPPAFTIITSEDIKQKKYQPIIEEEWSIHYVKELEKSAQKSLCLWPEHTMMGTPGHSLVPALYEVLYYHSLVYTRQISFQLKGLWPNSEMYGVFAPEIPLEFIPDHGQNIELLEELSHFDRILVAGEAKSHCVLESVKQMAHYFSDRPDVLEKIILLEDTMSSVSHPQIDFDAIANKEISELKRKGIKTAKSTELEL
ncbi:MAG: hypothetical protein JXR70_10100 [Spirochaetales bacterium]|nr:hypothetical protein [Spirochaetales bacterium]